MASPEFLTELARLQDSRPITKVEYIDVTDLSAYFFEGARFAQGK